MHTSFQIHKKCSFQNNNMKNEVKALEELNFS